MSSRTLDVDIALDARAEVGEGPSWDAPRARLVWVDITAGLVHEFDPSSAVDRVTDVGTHVGAAVPAPDGSLVLAVRDGIALLRPGRSLQLLAAVEADRPENRMNDAKVDPAGRLWAGTMPYDHEARPDSGALYRYDGIRVSEMVRGVTLSNGLDWSPDGATMYFIDSPRHTVDAFDFDMDSGTLRNRRTLVTIEARVGMPDGMAVDVEGNLWVAVWGSGTVRCYRPSGQLVTTITVPASRVTSCAFGGPHGDQLYITSARHELSPEQLHDEPHAGALFVVEPGTSGPPATPFAGPLGGDA